MVGGLRDVITCAEFQIEIFMGYDFTGGRIFDFPIDFSMGLTTVQRYCAACDSKNQTVIDCLQLLDTKTRDDEKMTSFPKSCICICWVTRQGENDGYSWKN